MFTRTRTVAVLAMAALPAAAQTTDVAKWTRDLASTSGEVRRDAASKLNHCAAACSAALPALVTMMQGTDPRDVSEAAFALQQILTGLQTPAAALFGAAPPAAFTDGCRAVRPTARRVLKSAAPATTSEAEFAQTATITLLALCAEVEDVPSLARIVAAAAFRANTRLAAIGALSKMGPAAAGALPALQAVAGDASDKYADILVPRAKAAIDSIQGH
jgi:hypothetical protein